MKVWNAHSARVLSAAMFAAVGHAAFANSAIVYYKPATSWTTTNIHYGVNGTWTNVPGVAMDNACTGWKSKTVDVGSATSWQVTFNNGAGTWDNNAGKNYTVGTGIVTINNGVVTTTSPCGDITPPTVPTGLTAGTIASTSASFSWTASTDNVGVVAYDIFRNGSKINSSTTTSFTDTGLTPNTAYSYTVSARDAAGASSAQSTALPITTLPAGTNSATVYYKPAAGWTSINIHYGINNTWTTPPGVAMTLACTGWYARTVSLGDATSFAATFNNGSGTWDNNGSKNYTLGTGNVTVSGGVIGAGNPCAGVDTKPPSVPASVISTGTTASSISLSWAASTDDVGVTGYNIYRNGAKVNSSATPSYTDTGLAANTAYSYTISAFDAAKNESAQSAPPLTVSTQPATDSSAVVYYYTGTRGWSSVNIHYGLNGTWTTPPGTAMNEAGCTNWVKKTVNLGALTSMKADFNNGSTWDNNGGIDYTINAGTTTVKDGVVTTNAAAPCVIDTTPPSNPTTLAGTADGTTVTLTWIASTDPESPTITYVITRTGGSGAQTFTATTNRYVDSSGAPNTTYSYTVVAKNATGLSSGASNTAPVTTGNQTVPKKTFSWDNATVYFLLTDRFVNGDTTNDRSYGRESAKDGTPFNNRLSDFPATFHGGDLKGLLSKINEGYFDKLGINAIWMSAPYEQIHGFVSGDGHKHYGYHGYYALDFSSMDKNMGSRADLQAVVDAAHAKGIRIVMDVVMNHAGYDTLKDMWEFGFGGLINGWENTAFKTDDLVDYNTHIKPYMDPNNANWSQWWSPDWLRVSNGLVGYSACTGTDGLTGCVGYLPDFRTDNFSAVGLPPLLVNKWTKEGTLNEKKASLDAWFSQTGRQRTPVNHLVKWLTDYVRDFGIDGFRVDTAKHVELANWKVLKDEAQRARRDWIAANPAKAALLTGDTDFWMTGEAWGHGTDRDGYFDNGFDSMINFNFKGAANSLTGMESTYVTLAGVNTDNSKPYNLLSYISSHDVGLYDRANLKTGLAALLMAPGGVQIFYGDESGRPNLACCGDHVWRGDMNWSSPDTAALAHAQKLGKFRNAHVAVGAGSHQKLADSPYTFARTKGSDKVVVAFGASGNVSISVAGVFADGLLVRDAYTGATATVAGGRVSVTADSNGVVLLEDAATVQ